MTTRIQRGRTAPAQPQWFRTLALLCALLVGAIGTAQAAHIHGSWLPQNQLHASVPADASQGQGEEHCPLCVAMHSALPVTMHAVLAPVLQIAQRLTARVLTAPQKLLSFAMFSRPPPVVEQMPATDDVSQDALNAAAAAA